MWLSSPQLRKTLKLFDLLKFNDRYQPGPFKIFSWKPQGVGKIGGGGELKTKNKFRSCCAMLQYESRGGLWTKCTCHRFCSDVIGWRNISQKKRHIVKANLFWKNDPSHHDRFVRVLVVAVFICKDLGSWKIFLILLNLVLYRQSNHLYLLLSGKTHNSCKHESQ